MEFDVVVREWARCQLERSDHTGPFNIVCVRLDLNERLTGYIGDDDEVDVTIKFDHDYSACAYRLYDGSPCRITLWSPMAGSKKTIILLNELLALADRQATS